MVRYYYQPGTPMYGTTLSVSEREEFHGELYLCRDGFAPLHKSYAWDELAVLHNDEKLLVSALGLVQREPKEIDYAPEIHSGPTPKYFA